MSKTASIVIVILASGSTYLAEKPSGKEGAPQVLTDAMPVIDNSHVDRSLFERYLRCRNLGQLQTIQFSAASGYTIQPLTPVQQAEFDFVSGLFDMAKKQAKAYGENRCFDELFAGK